MGFYSAFLVADRVTSYTEISVYSDHFICSPLHQLSNVSLLYILKVTVSTKSPKSEKQYVWEGEEGSSSYTIKEETDPQLIIPRGTRITLHLKVRNALVFFCSSTEYLFCQPYILNQLVVFLWCLM